MRKTTSLLPLLFPVMLGSAGMVNAEERPPLRPPSVPLVACDPYFSIWSPQDNLTDGPTTHWTGKPQRLECSVKIDGKAYQLMGKPANGPASLPQTRPWSCRPARSMSSSAAEWRCA